MTSASEDTVPRVKTSMTFARGPTNEYSGVWSTIQWYDKVKLKLFGHTDIEEKGVAYKSKNTITWVKRGGRNIL